MIPENVVYSFDDVKEVKKLIKLYDINPSVNRNYYIRYAAANHFPDIVEYLLKDSRVDPSDCDNSAIRMALHNLDYQTANILLKDSRVKYDQVLPNLSEKSQKILKKLRIEIRDEIIDSVV